MNAAKVGLTMSLDLTRIWDDADMVECRCRVDTGAFRGESTCYAGHGQLEEFAQQLSDFVASNFAGRPTFHCAMGDGTKAVKIEVYAINMAKHLAARVTLVTEGGRRPEETARLEVEFGIDWTGLEVLVNGLRGIKKVGDSASLPGNPRT